MLQFFALSYVSRAHLKDVDRSAYRYIECIQTANGMHSLFGRCTIA